MLGWEVIPRIPLGNFSVSPHGVGIAIGYFIGATLMARRARKTGFSEDHAWNAAVVGILGAIVGARIAYVIGHSDQFTEPIEYLQIYKGGISLMGGLVGGFLAAYLYCRVKKLDFVRLADMGAAGLAIGTAIGRIGDLVIGDHLGRTTEGFWGWEYKGGELISAPPCDPSVYPSPDGCIQPGMVVHQTALYDSIWALVIFLVILRLERKPRRKGALVLTWAAMYSMGRILMDLTRVDKTWFGTGLTGSQLTAIAILLFSLIALTRLRRAPKVGAVTPAGGEPIAAAAAAGAVDGEVAAEPVAVAASQDQPETVATEPETVATEPAGTVTEVVVPPQEPPAAVDEVPSVDGETLAPSAAEVPAPAGEPVASAVDEIPSEESPPAAPAAEEAVVVVEPVDPVSPEAVEPEPAPPLEPAETASPEAAANVEPVEQLPTEEVAPSGVEPAAEQGAGVPEAGAEPVEVLFSDGAPAPEPVVTGEPVTEPEAGLAEPLAPEDAVPIAVVDEAAGEPEAGAEPVELLFSEDSPPASGDTAGEPETAAAEQVEVGPETVAAVDAAEAVVAEAVIPAETIQDGPTETLLVEEPVGAEAIEALQLPDMAKTEFDSPAASDAEPSQVIGPDPTLLEEAGPISATEPQEPASQAERPSEDTAEERQEP